MVPTTSTAPSAAKPSTTWRGRRISPGANAAPTVASAADGRRNSERATPVLGQLWCHRCPPKLAQNCLRRYPLLVAGRLPARHRPEPLLDVAHLGGFDRREAAERPVEVDHDDERPGEDGHRRRHHGHAE